MHRAAQADCGQAAISSDNHLRIYECLEQPALSSWQLIDEVNISSLSSSSTHPGSIAGTIAPGTPTPAAAGAITFDGASVSSMLQTAQQQQAIANPSRPGVGVREADGGWCLSWCKERYWGEVLAVGCGVSGVVKVRKKAFRIHLRSCLHLIFHRSSKSLPIDHLRPSCH